MKPTTFYDILGVSPDATADEIKAAYRRAARDAHPDRSHGNSERMARVNAAHDVLSDPARRRHYDATGDGGPARNLEKMARDMVCFAFETLIDAGSAAPLADARARLTKTAETFRTKKREAGRAVLRLEGQRNFLSVREGENLYASVITRKIDALARDIAMADESIEVYEMAIVMLNGYTSAEPATHETMSGQSVEQILSARQLAGMTGAYGAGYGAR